MQCCHLRYSWRATFLSFSHESVLHKRSWEMDVLLVIQVNVLIILFGYWNTLLTIKQFIIYPLVMKLLLYFYPMRTVVLGDIEIHNRNGKSIKLKINSQHTDPMTHLILHPLGIRRVVSFAGKKDWIGVWIKIFEKSKCVYNWP